MSSTGSPPNGVLPLFTRVHRIAMKKIALLVTLWLLLASTTTVFRQLAACFGPMRGYFGGFLSYWILWCLLLPMWVLGARRLPILFRTRVAPSRQPNRTDLFLLAVPPTVGYSFAFSRAPGQARLKASRGAHIQPQSYSRTCKRALLTITPGMTHPSLTALFTAARSR